MRHCKRHSPQTRLILLEPEQVFCSFNLIMRVAPLVAVLLLLLVAFASAEKLLVATADSIEPLLSPHKLALVLFSRTDRCPLCPLLETELESARDFIASARKDIPIVKINCDNDNAAAIKYGVGTYPTVKLFSQGREAAKPYRGHYTGIEIAQYLMDSAEAPSRYVATLDDAKEVVPGTTGASLPPGSKIVIFGFFKLVNADLQHLQEAERELRDTGFFTFVHASTDEVFNFYGARNTFAVFVPGDEKAPPVFPSTNRGLDVDQVLEFVANKALPAVAQINGTNSFLYQRATRPVFRLYTDLVSEENAGNVAAYTEGLAQVAANVPEMAFTIANIDFGMEAAMDLKVLDYGASSVNAGGGWAIYQKGRKFRPEEDPAAFSVEGALAFARRYLGENPPSPYLQSQPVPLDDGPAGVVTVVGKTFRNVVFDESKLVVVLLQAPWCGHCKALMPMWEQFGKAVAASPLGTEKNVVIAQIDATANELPRGYAPNGYPTIYAALPGQKYTPREYQGDRSIDAFTNFVEQMLSEIRTTRD